MRYMDIRLKTTDYQMTDIVQSYLDDRVATIEKHLGERANKARIEIELGRAGGHSKHGENWFAEFQVTIPGGEHVRVVAQGETMNAAIDAAKDECLMKIKKDRTRYITNMRHVGAKVKQWLKGGH